MSGPEKFNLTETHLKLLKNMYVGWNDCEYGAPEIDPKRPYGNSNVENDMMKILGIKVQKSFSFDGVEYTAQANEDDDVLPDALYKKLRELHKETEIALQICLRFQTFEPGWYKRENSWSDWKRVADCEDCADLAREGYKAFCNKHQAKK